MSVVSRVVHGALYYAVLCHVIPGAVAVVVVAVRYGVFLRSCLLRESFAWCLHASCLPSPVRTHVQPPASPLCIQMYVRRWHRPFVSTAMLCVREPNTIKGVCNFALL